MGAGGNVFSVGKSKAKMYEKGGELGITFKDVAGQAGAKQEIQEIVESVEKEGSPKSVVVLREQAGAVSNRYRTVSI